ncbi:MAG: COG1470 family protein [Planctomycetota bacterium]|jgi:hypothetical protein
MKKIVGPLLAVFLVLGMLSVAQAFCTGTDCVDDLCVDVDIGVMPRCVDPGETITVFGSIKNNMRCRDLFKIKVHLSHGDIPTTDFVAKRKWMCPRIIIPLDGGKTFKFSYEATVPRKAPPGKYTITMSAEGIHSGVYDEDSATFYVGPCPSSVP